MLDIGESALRTAIANGTLQNWPDLQRSMQTEAKARLDQPGTEAVLNVWIGVNSERTYAASYSFYNAHKMNEDELRASDGKWLKVGSCRPCTCYIVAT